MERYPAADVDEAVDRAKFGESRALCPICQPHRRGPGRLTPTLAIRKTSTEALYHCHHCGLSGRRGFETDWERSPRRGLTVVSGGRNVGGVDRRALGPEIGNSPAPSPPTSTPTPSPPSASTSTPTSTSTSPAPVAIGGEGSPEKSGGPSCRLQPVSLAASGFLAGRGISPQTWERCAVGTAEGQDAVIGFPYCDDAGAVLALKLRDTRSKRFWADGAPRVFYRPVPDADWSGTLWIVEGEMDALALVEAGIDSVVSVPNGAPSGPVSETNSLKFSFLAQARELISHCERIVVAVDADEPGAVLRDELCKRMGRGVWHLDWAEEGCKDANEGLLMLGKEGLRDFLERAPKMSGVSSVGGLRENLSKLYRGGRVPGMGCGIASVDRLYTAAPGQVTVVTGIPNRGKSSFLDALLVAYAQRHGARFGLLSMEHDPTVHASLLMERYLRLPFAAGKSQRATEGDIDAGAAWLEKHFWWLDAEIEPTLESVFGRAAELARAQRLNGLVIDPYNYLARPANELEVDFINRLLTMSRQFARAHSCHVWIVAHPRILRDKSREGVYSTPGGYEIAGSAHWFSKCDCGLTIDAPEPGVMTVDVWKVRYSWLGQKGKATLLYNPDVGTISEFDLEI